MKYSSLLIIPLLLTVKVFSQSPYLSVKLKMDAESIKHTAYQIEMKFCEPNKKTESTGLISNDTSSILLNALKTNEVNCGIFFKNGEGKEILTGDKTISKYNIFEYGNQVFAWEKLLVFRISDTADNDPENVMYIILPMVYKSFRTSVEITDVVFQPGKMILADKLTTEYADKWLQISCKKISDCSTNTLDILISDWIKN